jgi:hypothetical protein
MLKFTNATTLNVPDPAGISLLTIIIFLLFFSFFAKKKLNLLSYRSAPSNKEDTFSCDREGLKYFFYSTLTRIGILFF